MTWQGIRGRQLPTNWPTIRARILQRDPYCRCEGCRRCTPQGCQRPSTDVDHTGPPHLHHDTNLRGLCRVCHATRSSTQGATARTTQRGTLTRTPEPHPGTT